MTHEGNKKSGVKRLLIMLTCILLAAIIGFVLCVTFKVLIARLGDGLKTQFYLHESALLSDYEAKYVQNDGAELIWEIDDEGIISIVEDNGVKKLYAAGIGKATVRLMSEIKGSQERVLLIRWN